MEELGIEAFWEWLAETPDEEVVVEKIEIPEKETEPVKDEKENSTAFDKMSERDLAHYYDYEHYDFQK